MINQLKILFTPTSKLVSEKRSEFSRRLDEVARNQVARFSRGNASMQVGLFEFEEELEAKVEKTLNRLANSN